MTCGIYCLRNTQTNKLYIGSSVNIQRRIRIHFWKLTKGNHNNQHLQNSFNKYGKDSLKFEILEECSVDNLIVQEQIWIEKYDFNRDLYNQCPIAYSTTARPASEETRKLMSKNNGKYWLGKERTQETKELISRNLFGKGKPVKQIDKNSGEVLNIFSSASSAARSLGIVNNSKISSVAKKNGINKSAYGFFWEYVNE